MKVPFLDLKLQHAPLMEEFTSAIQEVIASGAFAGGSHVVDFEKEFAAFCGTRHAIGVGSGTEALWLSLLALGIGAGDEVITVPNTFMATAEAITHAGAKPVFAEVDPVTYTINPEELEKSITPKTKAIIPVHIFGQSADMDPIQEVARRHGLSVIADACQAHGAEYNGQKAATIGDAVCFSFYPGKNIGAFGEAGAIVTDNAGLQEKIRILRDHGQIRKYHHTMVGWNCRMDGIQAAVLRVKLRHLENGNRLRRTHAAHYDDALMGVEGIVTPVQARYARHVYHIYAIRTKKRDDILQFLKANGIECGIHYPVPVHLQEAYRDLGYKPGSFPIAEQCAQEFISLPMFPELKWAEVEMVVQTLKTALASTAEREVGHVPEQPAAHEVIGTQA